MQKEKKIELNILKNSQQHGHKTKIIMEKLVSIKILRPITLPIIGALLIVYIIVAYVFDLEM